MKTEPIALTLIRGSRNIDLMRREIDYLVKLMISLCWANQEKMLKHIPDEILIKGKHGEWKIEKRFNQFMTPNTRVVIAYSITCGKSENSWVYSSESSDGMTKSPMESVQSVWEDLTTLVDGIISALPKIKGFRWEALVRAAAVEIA